MAGKRLPGPGGPGPKRAQRAPADQRPRDAPAQPAARTARRCRQRRRRTDRLLHAPPRLRGSRDRSPTARPRAGAQGAGRLRQFGGTSDVCIPVRQLPRRGDPAPASAGRRPARATGPVGPGRFHARRRVARRARRAGLMPSRVAASTRRPMRSSCTCSAGLSAASASTNQTAVRRPSARPHAPPPPRRRPSRRLVRSHLWRVRLRRRPNAGNGHAAMTPTSTPLCGWSPRRWGAWTPPRAALVADPASAGAVADLAARA